MPNTTITAMLTVVGGLTAATLPSTARANCNPSGGAPSIQPAPIPSAPRFDVQAEYKAGIAALEADNFIGARIAFERVLTVAPRNADVLYLAGYARMATKDWPRALKQFKKAVKIKPDMVLAQEGLGMAYAMTQDRAGAQAVLATLQMMATNCADRCTDSADLKIAVARVTSAMTEGGTIADTQSPPAATTG